MTQTVKSGNMYDESITVFDAIADINGEKLPEKINLTHKYPKNAAKYLQMARRLESIFPLMKVNVVHVPQLPEHLSVWKKRRDDI